MLKIMTIAIAAGLFAAPAFSAENCARPGTEYVGACDSGSRGEFSGEAESKSAAEPKGDNGGEAEAK